MNYSTYEEPCSEKSIRKANELQCLQSKRAPETHKETLLREDVIEHVLPKREPFSGCQQNRALETLDEALLRQKQDKELYEDYSQRKRRNRIAMTVKVCQWNVLFMLKSGLAQLATCYHCMMYRKSVIACNRANYTKASADVVQMVFSPNLS